ncbi:Cell wall / vacuolar inhibitor of fructosidase 1 [Cardamine amara subsp. amara]|uniref:Cell wall / vacuolar inhibitor of fructosidase 1 n=1 Tax=Cardamine amara subsp. amara TaxID=228776 RepID=A0ABD1CA86_CARAN
MNIYPTLCVSTLNLDHRSKNSNIKGLALISVDATSKKFTDSLEYITSVFKKIKDPKDWKRYEICIMKYNTVVHWILPTALANLKAAKHHQAKSDMNSVLAVPNICEAQFVGSSPLTERNKAVHDIADMTADIIRYLFAN